MFWFFLFFLWFWLVITIFRDIIRSHDLTGWAKAAWAIAIIVIPYLGIFLYLVVRGGTISERQAREAQWVNGVFAQPLVDSTGLYRHSASSQQRS
jgi:hypothetical protein